MKTINEAAEIEAKLKHGFDMEEEKYYQSNKVNVYDAFKNGVEFAQRWIPVEEELPITYESGVWDGLRGSFVIVYNSFGEWHKARPYSGFLDGHNFYDWYSESDYMLSNITHWRPIERS